MTFFNNIQGVCNLVILRFAAILFGYFNYNYLNYELRVLFSSDGTCLESSGMWYSISIAHFLCICALQHFVGDFLPDRLMAKFTILM